MNINCVFFVSFSIITFTNALSVSENQPFVNTLLGQINGYSKKTANGRPYAVYEGIPYALKPVGKLRFQVKIIFKNIFVKCIDYYTLICKNTAFPMKSY